MPLLEINNVSVHFGELKAVSEVDFYVNNGEIVSLIGPNGAGKTTLLNVITGLLKPTFGSIEYKGKDLTRNMMKSIINLGISRTFQHVRLFEIGDMTVLDNIIIGFHHRYRHSLLGAIFHLKNARNAEREIKRDAIQILQFTDILHLADYPVAELSFGEKRLVELSRALAASPELLILDEPAAGLNDIETENFSKLIKDINSKGVTILLVEHHMGLVMNISDRIVVLNYGKKLAEGTPDDIKNNEFVIEAYLGKEEEIASNS